MARFSIFVPSVSEFPHARAFDEVAEACKLALGDLGHSIEITSEPSRLEGHSIVLGANLIAGTRTAAALPDTALLFNLEQVAIDSPWWSDDLESLFRAHRLLDYSATNIDALAALGMADVTHCPIGYHPELTRIRPGPDDIDILFYGSLNERRSSVLQELHARGLRVHHAFGVYGAERDALIGRARISLNVHFYEQRVFEMVRVSYLLANERFVVSESGSDTGAEAEFASGLVFCGYDELVDVCVDFVDSPAREIVAGAGLELMADRPQAAYLEAALDAALGVTSPTAG